MQRGNAVSFMDLAPTLIEWAGGRIPEDMQGESLVSATRTGPWQRRSPVYSEKAMPTNLAHVGQEQAGSYTIAPRRDRVRLTEGPCGWESIPEVRTVAMSVRPRSVHAGRWVYSYLPGQETIVHRLATQGYDTVLAGSLPKAFPKKAGDLQSGLVKTRLAHDEYIHMEGRLLYDPLLAY